jgi:hypothetical protein
VNLIHAAEPPDDILREGIHNEKNISAQQIKTGQKARISSPDVH